MNLTACIITNNDKRVLDTVKSVKESCNEIILVETSGRNDFQDELKKYGVKLFWYKWNDNFSEARNYSISKATGDWILIIDSDEILKSKIVNLPEKYDLYYCDFEINGTTSGGGRIFKNDGKIKFENLVHETVEYMVSDDKKCRTNTIIEHRGYEDNDELMKGKLFRNFKLLLRDKNNRMRNYYLALTYMNFAKYKKAIEFSELALKDKLPNEMKARLCIAIFDCYKEMERISLYYLYCSLNYISKQITARLRLYYNLTDAKQRLNQLYEMVNIIYKGRTDLQNDIPVSAEFLKEEIKNISNVL